MERQNFTLPLPKGLLKKARERQLRLLKAELNLGTKGHLAISWEEIHARD
jgi:hypothetical protein